MCIPEFQHRTDGIDGRKRGCSSWKQLVPFTLDQCVVVPATSDILVWYLSGYEPITGWFCPLFATESICIKANCGLMEIYARRRSKATSPIRSALTVYSRNNPEVGYYLSESRVTVHFKLVGEWRVTPDLPSPFEESRQGVSICVSVSAIQPTHLRHQHIIERHAAWKRLVSDTIARLLLFTFGSLFSRDRTWYATYGC